MHIYKNINNPLKQSCALTIGNFDGVHIGHQKILTKLVEEATARRITPSVLTFHPHSREFFQKNNNLLQNLPTRIYKTRDKIENISKYSIDQIFISKFNSEISQITANTFIEEFLVRNLNVKYLLIGENFQFGYKRQGNLETLQKASLKYNFEVQTIKRVIDNHNNRISSSQIREALKLSNITLANSLLGRNFGITGHVIHGNKIGRKLGYPTMNISVPQNYALSKGVYLVYVYGLENKKIPGVASLGTRETLEKNGILLLEISLIDVNITAYGKLIHIEFIKKLRNEEKFPDIESLIHAISTDIKNARSYFNTHGL
ncbi:riboflavin kinase/FMN adenylyltransferase [Candidatus Kinetoplastibacterium desouzaii TCC079E]|uniref:Riboflavin biosynthesis protein n=1 Tax=Candidatus Kinetoplastidibacterium desouzai TCC079E TaxID=1208919 RepID=M1L211_9PROT|nr:bifunctional riboflavin kinase/FAD synthetase [Candidatus Kinetoplastibacterium desouzaii]AGF46788.1 riboflavin kinase/FMN adenylyltransferase [Candidatus Kinetoplastibacterium desouzaii TCC079E]